MFIGFNKNVFFQIAKMVRQGCELPANSSTPNSKIQSPTSGTRAPVTSPTSPISPISGQNGSGRIPELTSPTSSIDSRIPRPSPTELRRSSSMRLRGERVSHHQLRASGAFGTSTIQGYHQRHSTGVLQYQDLFPAITENGVDSPRHRSLVSYFLPFNLM